jgi:hypothetical protein
VVGLDLVRQPGSDADDVRLCELVLVLGVAGEEVDRLDHSLRELDASGSVGGIDLARLDRRAEQLGPDRLVDVLVEIEGHDDVAAARCHGSIVSSSAAACSEEPRTRMRSGCYGMRSTC